LAAKYHFTSTEQSAKRVEQIIGHADGIFNVGSLSLDNLNEIPLLTKEEFYSIYKIDLTIPTLLFTFHPETISFEKNEEYIQTLVKVLKNTSDQVVVTMPNADTNGTIIRTYLKELAADKKNIFLIENFGTRAYFSCMKYVQFLLGNSSSGIIEAASFGKYVINIGQRQQGREQSENVLNCEIDYQKIMNAIEKVKNLPSLSFKNIYGQGNASQKMIDILKKIECIKK
jgi:GDP/UDP-N,N'-diacetylbacillosamine 2-epimerase (hydrolysing)